MPKEIGVYENRSIYLKNKRVLDACHSKKEYRKIVAGINAPMERLIKEISFALGSRDMKW